MTRLLLDGKGRWHQQKQRQQQIPYGDDNKKDKGYSIGKNAGLRGLSAGDVLRLKPEISRNL
jgi:hypothetical protein